MKSKKILLVLTAIFLVIALTSCFNTTPNTDEYAKIIVYLTDAPNESISEATLKVLSMKLTSASTTIGLLSNYENNFLNFAGKIPEKIKEFNISEKDLKNAKISVILSPTATIVEENKTKSISISSTEIDVTVDIDSISNGRTYNLIIDFDIGNSYSSAAENFNPIIRSWIVADTIADYRDIEGYVYDDEDLEDEATPKSGRVVLILPTDYSTVLYSTITNEDGYFKFNKIKLDAATYKIGVAKTGVDFSVIEPDEENAYLSYIIEGEKSLKDLEQGTNEINLSIGDQ